MRAVAKFQNGHLLVVSLYLWAATLKEGLDWMNREGFMMAAQLQRSGGSAAAVADSGDAQVEIVELPPE